MKQVALILVALLIVSGIAVGQEIQKGDFAATSAKSEGWSLASGTGDRVHVEFITFDKSFDAPPTVLVSLTGYDASTDERGSVRINVKVDKITKGGCVLKVITWGSSKVTGVFGSWLAIGK